MTHPTTLQKGDLIFWDNTTDHALIHVGMYIGYNQVIEALPIVGVSINPLSGRKLVWDIEKWAYPKYIWDKPEAERKAIIDKAIAFCKSQKWKRYQAWYLGYTTSNWNPYDYTDTLANKWTCAELIWAGYMNATNGQLNISNAQLISGTKYKFVTYYSVLNDSDMVIYKTPTPK